MRVIDEQYTACPFYGSRRIARWLARTGHEVNRKRVQRLLRLMGLEAIHVKPKLSAGRGHKVYPYLLRDVPIERVGQVWSADITYVPTREGWLYLAVVVDLFSRMIVGWSMAETMESRLVVDALHLALGRRRPEAGLLAHSDRGSQYASLIYQAVLRSCAIQPSMSRTANCYDKDYVSYCTSSVHSDATSGNVRRLASLRPWHFVGGLGPGGSNKQLFLSS